MINLKHRSYISYAELRGLKRRTSMATIRRRINQLKYTNVILQLAQMNTLLAMSVRSTEDFRNIQGALAANFLDEELYEKGIQKKFGTVDSDLRPIFFRQQILALLRLCALECSDDAPLIVDGHTPGGFELGRCCLMMSDHLVSSEQENAITKGTSHRKRKHLGLQMATTFELNNPPEISRAIVRSDIVFTDILQSEAMRRKIEGPLRGFDIAAKFYEATGLTLEEYRDLVLITLVWYLRDPKKVLENPGILQIHRERYISASSITQEQFDRFLKLDSTHLSHLPKKIREQMEKFPSVLPQYDFVAFRRWPLIELENGNLICVDPSFLIEKLDSGFHWTIINSLSNEEDRRRALQAFGHLFELYVDRLMREMFPPKSGLFLSFPNFQNGNESFDGIVCHDDHLIVMEYKGGVLTQQAKCGGKIKTFEADLDKEKKFGIGKGGGVYQLANKIERLLHQDRTKRDSIPGLLKDMGVIKKVTPVLIVQEPFLRFDFMNFMLNNRFQKLRKQRQITKAVEVAPLQVIDIDSLERIALGVQAGVMRFDQCLNVRAFDDKDLVSSFSTFPWEFFFPGFTGLANADLDRRVDEIFSRIKQPFFVERPT